MLWKIGGDGAKIGGGKCENRARYEAGMWIEIWDGLFEIRRNTVQKPCQKINYMNCFVGWAWCENRARNAGMRVRNERCGFEIRDLFARK